MRLCSKKSGLTLIELILLMTLFALVITGAIKGMSLGGKHGFLMGLGGFLGGGAVGLGAFLLGIFAFSSLLYVVGAIARLLSPADLVCNCDASTVVPAHLTPQSELAIPAMEASKLLYEWSEYAHVVKRARASENTTIKIRGFQSPMLPRLLMAANLLDRDLDDLDESWLEPQIDFRNWAKLPEDLWFVLRCGLPPRLCMVWALACVKHVLPFFEEEFHQDTRPRQICGTVLLVLRDANLDALEPWRDISTTWWSTREAGCRVVHRSWWERAKGKDSRGESAGKAAFELIRAVKQFVEPVHLWRTYPPGDIGNTYATPRNRCQWSQPAFNASTIAGYASRAADDRDAAFDWQRHRLADLILFWRPWDKDRRTWRDSVDEKWIPRILNELKNVRFDVSEYTEKVRRELVPWEPEEGEEE